jgi:hypothetical protein
VFSCWATRHTLSGGKRFPRTIQRIILELSNFPSDAKRVLGLVQNISKPAGREDPYLDCRVNSGNKINLAGYILVPYISSNGVNQVAIVDVSNGNTRVLIDEAESTKVAKYSDDLIYSHRFRQIAFSSRSVKYHPCFIAKNTIVYLHEFNDLIAFNFEEMKEVWRVKGAFHHSIEIGENKSIWVCASIDPSEFGKSNNISYDRLSEYEDQALVNVSINGKITDVISVSELLFRSGLEFLMFGVSNPNFIRDPIHLNQVTPILQDSAWFKRGQLLVSLRNLSTILIVDPKERRVVWHKSGPWMNQHCSAIISGSSISVLDNHSFASGEYWVGNNWRSRILTYDLSTSEIDEVKLRDPILRNLRIPVQGRATPIQAGLWMIEDSLHGTILIANHEEIIFKWSNHYGQQTVGISSWGRFLKEEQNPLSMSSDSQNNNKPK